MPIWSSLILLEAIGKYIPLMNSLFSFDYLHSVTMLYKRYVESMNCKIYRLKRQLKYYIDVDEKLNDGIEK